MLLNHHLVIVKDLILKSKWELLLEEHQINLENQLKSMMHGIMFSVLLYLMIGALEISKRGNTYL
jgi:hypothetical protein